MTCRWKSGGLVPSKYDVDASQEERLSLRAIDDPAIVDRLYELAGQAAKRQFSLEDFDGFVPNRNFEQAFAD